MFTKLMQAMRRSSNETSQILGLTIPDLLMASCREYPNLATFFQRQGMSWKAYTNEDLRTQVSEAALGLSQLGLQKNDRVGLLLNSDFNFLVADLACATANLVTVPIDLSQTIEHIIFSLNHSDAKALIAATPSLLNQISPYLCQTENLQWVIVFESVGQTEASNVVSEASVPRPKDSPASIPASIGLELDETQPIAFNETWSDTRQHLSWHEVQHVGWRILSEHSEPLKQLETLRSPQDLATIIYTPHETGSLLGVMLSHENLTSTALASFAGMTGLYKGDRESVVTFLPLTHIFARMMLYGHLYYSHRVYFSTPRRVMKHLMEVKPTILTTVPLLLHRVYRRLKSYGNETHSTSTPKRRHLMGVDISRIKQATHQWAMAIALKPPTGISRIEKILATPIFLQWRKIFGGKIRYCLSGGAALNTTVARFFKGIGFPLYQGYGLTQTSSTVTFNHPKRNFPGTVGQVRDGIQCAIAQDGEVLVKGTGNLMGYFKVTNTDVIDEQGWLHTGDLGYLDTRGNLTLLGSKKNLFKLTTGKYVTPIPLEKTLMESGLIRHALVVGEERKFCAALLFVEPQALQTRATKMGLVHYSLEALIENPCIQTLFQALVDEANCHFPYWSTIKKIRLLPASDYPNSFRAYSQATIRNRLVQRFAILIEQLYEDTSEKRELNSYQANDCRDIPLVTCPITAQSLKTRTS